LVSFEESGECINFAFDEEKSYESAITCFTCPNEAVFEPTNKKLKTKVTLTVCCLDQLCRSQRGWFFMLAKFCL